MSRLSLGLGSSQGPLGNEGLTAGGSDALPREDCQRAGQRGEEYRRAGDSDTRQIRRAQGFAVRSREVRNRPGSDKDHRDNHAESDRRRK